MSKTVLIEITSASDFIVDWGGDLEGACCGPESSTFREKLSKIGIELELRKISCRLPKADSNNAKTEGICIVNLKNGAANA